MKPAVTGLVPRRALPHQAVLKGGLAAVGGAFLAACARLNPPAVGR